MRALALLVLLALAAGCTRAPAAEPADAATRALPDANAPLAPLAHVAPPPARLPVDVTLADPWVRPGEEVVAHATARATSYEWYVATRNPLATLVDGEPRGLAPGASATLDVRAAGRHAFGLEGSGARLNVSTLPGALALRIEARLVDDGAGARFAPAEAVGGEGSVVVLTNGLGETAIVQRTESMLPLGGREASLAFHMPRALELGDYDVVVVVRDGSGAVGDAAARLVYDSRKPDIEQTWGPWRGGFEAPPAPTGAEPTRHRWTSAHPLRTLEATFTVESGSPLPARLRFTLQGPDGAPLATSEGAPLSLAQLPAGDHTLVVEHLEGALVSYEALVEGEWRLVPPRSFFQD